MSLENTNAVQWILKQHKDTNHLYDVYLPYEFHLRMVVNVYNKFQHLIKNNEFESDDWGDTYNIIELACWGHDLIEDTRVTYNDVLSHLGLQATEIVYALTNEKGRNRKERANDKYYQGIRETPYASFVKLCDRIANVQYGKMTTSNMVKMYLKENNEFIRKVLTKEDYEVFKPMVDYLDNLLTS